jgi:hypothetical protein
MVASREAGAPELAGRERAHKLSPNLALAGSGGQELPAPRDFAESAASVTGSDIAEFAARELLSHL